MWTGLGLVALAILVTYARLPLDELYNVSYGGLEGGLGRVVVFAGYPTALVAIAILAVVVDRLRTTWVSVVAVVAAILCVTVAWPGVVEQDDLDVKPANALAAAGTLIALGLTILALRRGGVGYRRPFGGGWDVARLVVAVIVVFSGLPWFAAAIGFHLDDVPVLGSIFLTGVPRPEPGHPTLTAVHLGHHHGFDGTLLALVALALSRTVSMLRSGILRTGYRFYVSLMLVYGLANALQDFWLEQLVKRGTTSLEIPTLTVPEASAAWAAILAAALIIHFAAGRVGRLEPVIPGRSPMTRRLLLLALTALALVVAVAACGGDDDEESEAPTAEATTEDTGGGGGGDAVTIMLAADPGGDLAFDQTELTAAAGEVTIEFMNESGIPHNVEVEGNGVEEVSDTITEGSTDLTLTLEPGEYEFYCAVPGHREGGMEGTLTVE